MFDLADDIWLAIFAPHLVFGQVACKIRVGVAACGKQLENLANDARGNWVNVNPASFGVISVAKWGNTWPNPIAHFLPHPPSYVLAQVVHVILGLTKGDRQHKLALWGIVKPESGKLEINEFASIKQIDDFTSVYTVSG